MYQIKSLKKMEHLWAMIMILSNTWNKILTMVFRPPMEFFYVPQRPNPSSHKWKNILCICFVFQNGLVISCFSYKKKMEQNLGWIFPFFGMCTIFSFLNFIWYQIHWIIVFKFIKTI